MISFDVTRNRYIPLDVVGSQIPIKLDSLLRTAAQDIEGKAKSYAPYKTGNLRNSIKSEKRGDGYAVYTVVHYARFQEFGTKYMAGTSFMRPAAQEVASRINSIALSQFSFR